MPAAVYGESYRFLPKTELLTFEEITRLARVFVSLGVRKIRVTGGEPLLRRDLPELVGMLAAIENVEDLALTTNGSLLAENAEALKQAGLHRVTVSLDSLDERAFRKLNGQRHSVASVLDGIEAAATAGLLPIKINVVVVRGVNDGSIVELAERFKGTGHVVRFIEYMDVGNLNRWQAVEVFTAREIVERIQERFLLKPLDSTYRGEVARRYAYADGSGEIGVISSISAPFCGDCTRVRLSSDGRVVTCLFAATGTDFKLALRDGASDAQLRDLISTMWSRRTDRYSEQRAEEGGEDGPRELRRKIEMYQIGG
jgi:cyclic pyranopterin phosphate synthase